MMTETGDMFLIIGLVLAGVAMLSFALLKGWEDWLRFRRLELSETGPPPRAAVTGQRVELLDLRDRVKRLEAIASGMED
jgi:hypothetical protein